MRGNLVSEISKKAFKLEDMLCAMALSINILFNLKICCLMKVISEANSGQLSCIRNCFDFLKGFLVNFSC